MDELKKVINQESEGKNGIQIVIQGTSAMHSG
jgi:hypothetical protein